MRRLRLLDIPKKSKIYESCTDGSQWFVYNHPDGMYSHCTTEKGNTVHLGLSQPLVPSGDGFKFAPLEHHDDPYRA